MPPDLSRSLTAQAPPAAPAPAKAVAKPAPAKPTTARGPVKPTGRLNGLDLGVSDRPTNSTATTPPASVIGAAVKQSLAAELYRVLRPHWSAPTGADADKLRTTVEARLNPDGTLAGPPRVVNQVGVTDSNRVQAELHKERAIKAVRLAAPFKSLPPKFYEGWKVIRPTFDWRLSQ